MPSLRQLIDHYIGWLDHFGLSDIRNTKREALNLMLDTLDAEPTKGE